jgi:hypothetical protein
MNTNNDDEEDDLESIVSPDIETSPNEASDPRKILEAKIPSDIRNKFELASYRNAAVILSETRRTEFGELLDALRSFQHFNRKDSESRG